eukprot:2516085-Amphidinium_carterae.1
MPNNDEDDDADKADDFNDDNDDDAETWQLYGSEAKHKRTCLSLAGFQSGSYMTNLLAPDTTSLAISFIWKWRNAL